MRSLLIMAIGIGIVGCDSPPPDLDDPDRLARLAPRGEAPFDVILDTDVGNEIDDQFALVYALRAPDAMNVLAVTAAPFGYSVELFREGGGTTELDARILEADLRAAGIPPESVPPLHPSVGVRRAERQIQEWLDLLEVDVPLHGGSERYLPSATEPVESEAADAIVRIAREHDGPVHVLAMGALTNVASALLQAPDIADDLVVVWTSAYPTSWPDPNASFNLAQDVHATRAVFESGVPIVYVPGYFVAEELRTTLYEVDALLVAEDPVSTELRELYRGHPITGEHVGRSKVLWDVAVVAWVIDPTWTSSRIVRTPTLDDERRWTTTRGPAMREVTNLWRDAIFLDLWARIQAP